MNFPLKPKDLVEIQITVDRNDGDYETVLNMLEAEQLEKLKPLIEAIAMFKPYRVERRNLDWMHDRNFPWGETCRSDLGEKDARGLYEELFPEAMKILEDLLPCCEYGFHSITSIKYTPARAWISLLPAH